MINLAICDDNPKEAGQIEMLLYRLQEEWNVNLKLNIYLSGEELAEALSKGDYYDAIFLDIEMNQISGVDVGKIIRDKLANDNTQIVYISIHDDYHEQLYSTQPIGFIKKPIDTVKFTTVFKYVLERIHRTNETYLFKIGHDTYKIPKKDILYLEGSGRKIKLHTVKTKYVYYGSLSTEALQLPDLCFLLVHQSYLVNLDKVTVFNSQILMIGDNEIPISQHRRREIRHRIIGYMEDKMQWAK